MNRKPSPLLPGLAWAWLVLLALAVRLLDLTDPPLGFHPTRQMRSALLARYLYFRGHPPKDPARWQVVQEAVSHFGAYEPPVFEDPDGNGLCAPGPAFQLRLDRDWYWPSWDGSGCCRCRDLRS